jgi:hypothetical protein
MKNVVASVLMMASFAAVADSLPVFSIQPTNMTVSPGSTATLVASAAGATSYQWRFMGLDISGATGSALQISSTQTSNSGYYNVIAKNLTGWVPSQLAYLSLDYTYGGTDTNSVGWVPFSNVGGHQALYDANCAPGFWQMPINTGSVQVVAGLRLDQLVPIGVPIKYKKTTTGSYLNNGYYDYAPGVPVPSPANEMVPSAMGGQTIFYVVLFTYTNSVSV